jgi:hypothetical protein
VSVPQITGLVALIEDEYTLVINRGADAGVAAGMTFAVLAETSRRITDPETGRELGRLAEEKLRVKVFDVHPLFARAETYSTEVVRSPSTPIAGHPHQEEPPVLDPEAEPILTGMAELARYAGESLHEGVLTTAPSSEEVVTVNVGDEVELVDISPSN